MPDNSQENPASLAKTVEVVDLNAYARRKAAVGAALNLSLFSANTDQLATLVIDTKWDNLEITNFTLIVMSLWLQVRFILHGWANLAAGCVHICFDLISNIESSVFQI